MVDREGEEFKMWIPELIDVIREKLGDSHEVVWPVASCSNSAFHGIRPWHSRGLGPRGMILINRTPVVKVTTAVRELLMSLMGVTSAQYIFDFLAPALKHKAWRVRSSVLACLEDTLASSEFGNKSIAVKKVLPQICQVGRGAGYGETPRGHVALPFSAVLSESDTCPHHLIVL
jgi:hypothetical protein